MQPLIKLSNQCNRCPRQEERVVGFAEIEALKTNKAPSAKALEITMDGKLVATYGFLCKECRDIVTSYLLGAAKQSEKKTSKRQKKPKEAEAELEVAKEKVAAPSMAPPGPPGAKATQGPRGAGAASAKT